MDKSSCPHCAIAYEEGRKAGRKEVGQLARQILDLAEHGDYSNGNKSQGIDEGWYLAGQAIANFERQLKEWGIEEKP